MTKNTIGFSVRILFPDGEPEGLRIVEKSDRVAQGDSGPGGWRGMSAFIERMWEILDIC